MPGQMMIPPEILLPRIGAPDAPLLIDVCIDEDFALDPRLIPGAFRHPFAEIEDLAPDLDPRDVVVVCQKGLKLSQGAAALLRGRGVHARALEGGMVGWAARNYPAIPASALPPSRLVTSEQPSPDALAAIWLIRRFVRSDISVLFVTPDMTDAVSDRFGAAPLATFKDLQAMLTLASPSLTNLAAAIRGDAAETAGVTVALRGLRALYPDDLSYSAASMPLFDALHRAFQGADARQEGVAT